MAKGTSSIPILLRSPVNEERLLALAMPVDAFKRGGRAARRDRVGDLQGEKQWSYPR
jgi:hypothetical protein